MATMKDVPPEYDNIKSLDDQRKRPGPGIELMSHSGHLTLIDDPADIPPLPDKVVSVDPARLWELIDALVDATYSVSSEEYAGGHDTQWHRDAARIKNEIRAMLGLDRIPS